MMKNIFSLFLLLFLLGCSSQESRKIADAGTSNPSPVESSASGPANFEITVNGCPAGMVQMIGFYADNVFRVDSALVNAKGQFSFANPNGYPEGLYTLQLPGGLAMQLLLGEDQEFSMEGQYQNVNESMQVKGCLENELLYQNLRFQAQLDPQLQNLNTQLRSLQKGTPAHEAMRQEIADLSRQRTEHIQSFKTQYPKALFTKYKLAGQNPPQPDVSQLRTPEDIARSVSSFRKALWENVDFGDERLLRTPVIFSKLKRYMNPLTAQQPDSIILSASYLLDKVVGSPKFYEFFANWIMIQYEPSETTLMDPEAVYVHMMQHYFTYDRAHWADSATIYSLQLRAREMAGSLVGHKALDVQAPNEKGELKSILEIKAPYIIVYLFDPECTLCAEETPRLVAFYNQWKNRGVEVFSIVLNADEAGWKDYIRKNNLNWINVFDPTNQSFYGKYYVDHTPEIYVLNPDRTIIAKNLKVEQIAAVIEKDRQGR